MFHNHTILDATRVPKVAAAGFVGLGNIVAGAIYYSGLRAYSTATIGANAINIKRTDATTANLVTVTSGAIDTVAANAFANADTTAPSPTGPLTIGTVYDQVGTCHIGTNVCDYIRTAIGGTPGIVFGTAFNTATAGVAGPTRIQPFSLIMVIRHDTFVASAAFFGNDGQPHFSYSAANQVDLYAGTHGMVNGVSDGVYHSLQVVFSGAGSFVSIDGATPVTASASPGGNGLSGNCFIGSDAGGGQLFRGGYGEFAIYPGDVVTANRIAIYNNQHLFFGV